MANVARRHHTVPRFYLDHFAEDGQVGTVALPGDRRYRQSVTRASTENDFYSLGDPSAEGSDAFEKILAKLEGEAANVFRLVLGGTWPLDTDQRAVLAEFVAVQYLRGPNHRTHMQNMAAQLTRMQISMNGKEWMAGKFAEYAGRGIDDEQIDRLWDQATRQEGPPLSVRPELHVKQIVELLPKLIWYFAARPWSLIRFTRQRLLTCDTPVLLIPDDDHPTWSGVGLLNAWAIAFPLARDTALLMTSPAPIAEHTTREYVAAGNLDRHLTPSTQWARSLRRLSVENARRFIYHHPDDDELVPEGLPGPASSELVAPDEDFIAMGEAMRAAADHDGSTGPTVRDMQAE